MARLVLCSRLELRRSEGASNEAPTQAEKKLSSCPGLVDHYTHKRDWTDP
jgi:hypothetical protein